MAACAAVRLAGRPHYGCQIARTAQFSLARYGDPEYIKQLDNWDDSGQL
jgi:hypothetical protein